MEGRDIGRHDEAVVRQGRVTSVNSLAKVKPVARWRIRTMTAEQELNPVPVTVDVRVSFRPSDYVAEASGLRQEHFSLRWRELDQAANSSHTGTSSSKARRCRLTDIVQLRWIR